MKTPPLALWIGIGIGLLAAAAVVFAWPQIRQTAVTNFEECASAGNPVMESYPRQCRAGGKTFVEDVPGFDEPRPIDPPPGGGICVSRCGDGECAEIVCLGSGCPCAESPETCPQDCGKAR